MKGDARAVLREHACMDGPDPTGTGAGEQGLHESASDSSTPCALRDVDRALGDPGVARARRRRSESDPADDAVVLDGDEPMLGVVARIERVRSREAPSRTSRRGSRCPPRRSPRPRASRGHRIARISITTRRLGLRRGAVGDVRLLRHAGRLERAASATSWRSSSEAGCRRAAHSLPRSRAGDSGEPNPEPSYRKVLTIALERLAVETGLVLPEGRRTHSRRSLPRWPVFDDVRPD